MILIILLIYHHKLHLYSLSEVYKPAIQSNSYKTSKCHTHIQFKLIKLTQEIWLDKSNNGRLEQNDMLISFDATSIFSVSVDISLSITSFNRN